MRWVTIIFLLMGQAAFADASSLATINAVRANNGLAALSYNERLEAVARKHGHDMISNGFFAHAGSDGSDVGTRLRRGRYQWCFAAENLAYGQRSLNEVMTGWMNSRGHRLNILSRHAKQVGLARVPNNRWVMVLAAPC